MNKIVRERHPVAERPENLREGLEPSSMVRVTIEQMPDAIDARRSFSLDDLSAMRRPPFRSMEDITAEVRRQRDEWDDRFVDRRHCITCRL